VGPASCATQRGGARAPWSGASGLRVACRGARGGDCLPEVQTHQSVQQRDLLARSPNAPIGATTRSACPKSKRTNRCNNEICLPSPVASGPRVAWRSGSANYPEIPEGCAHASARARASAEGCAHASARARRPSPLPPAVRHSTEARAETSAETSTWPPARAGLPDREGSPPPSPPGLGMFPIGRVELACRACRRTCWTVRAPRRAACQARLGLRVPWTLRAPRATIRLSPLFASACEF